jgi:2-hydroxychromene-2-carboxylate isomerase
MESSPYDIEFYWDPICPFAWITSRWVTTVAELRGYRVDWRFISLWFLNSGRDYDKEFPPQYLALHTKGLRMLRVAAASRATHGPDSIGLLYSAFGESIWDRTRQPGVDTFEGIGDREHLQATLSRAGLPTALADAADTDHFDAELRDETQRALTYTGREVGTPIVVFQPPEGFAFFGPVISRIPDAADALRLWDAVTTLGTWPGFAELKRTMREMPRLRLLEASG